MSFYLGIDFGTSGARGVVIDATGSIVADANYNFAKTLPTELTREWHQALWSLIYQISLPIRQEIISIAIDGTSATVLLCDQQGNPVTPPLLYNDNRGITVMEQLYRIAPSNSIVLSPTSSLAKLLWFTQTLDLSDQPYYLLHQADWLAFLLHGQLGISDYHNSLKLGYNPEKLCYPTWIESLPTRVILPQVIAPGTPVSEVNSHCSDQLGLNQKCRVCTGTTDSIAAFIASGVTSPGEAVTSLGSTLVLKLLSHTRVDHPQYGIYSHRLGSLWLTGGASNTGGAVLREFFTDEELARLSQDIDPTRESPLDYYPLIKPGDRFPINDPNLSPRLEPKPTQPVDFLHGLLESIARIEAQGYRLLQELGATALTRVYTAGGGAKNPIWTAIRYRHLQVPVAPSHHTDAAYGTAQLARGNGE